MHWRMRMLAGLEGIERLKKDTAQPPQLPDHLLQLGIVSERQVPRVLEGRVEIQLESDLHDMIGPIPHVKRIMVEANLPFRDRLAQRLFVDEGVVQHQRNHPARSLTGGPPAARAADAVAPTIPARPAFSATPSWDTSR